MYQNDLPIRTTPVRCPPVFSLTAYISPGPHLSEGGKLDHRVWFMIPTGYDEKTGGQSCILFPFGAKSDEFRDLVL